jgi:hypothetical protein
LVPGCHSRVGGILGRQQLSSISAHRAAEF